MEHISARIMKNKLGLLNLAAELSNVSKSVQCLGVSRMPCFGLGVLEFIDREI